MTATTTRWLSGAVTFGYSCSFVSQIGPKDELIVLLCTILTGAFGATLVCFASFHLGMVLENKTTLEYEGGPTVSDVMINDVTAVMDGVPCPRSSTWAGALTGRMCLAQTPSCGSCLS